MSKKAYEIKIDSKYYYTEIKSGMELFGEKGLFVSFEKMFDEWENGKYLQTFSDYIIEDKVLLYKFKDNILKVGKIIDLENNFKNSYKNDLKYFFYKILREFQWYCEKNEKEIMDFSNKYMLRYLLTLIQLLKLEHIVIVDSDTMRNLAVSKYRFKGNFEYNNNNIFTIPEEKIKSSFSIVRKMETMGLYVEKISIKMLEISDKFKKLYEKFKIEGLDDDVVEINNLVFVCLENQEFFYSKLNERNKDILTKSKLNSLVFAHEIGHLIFNYVNNKTRRTNERQANFMSSLLYNGIYDLEIKIKTDQQLDEYHDPLLITTKFQNYDLFCIEYEKLFEED